MLRLGILAGIGDDPQEIIVLAGKIAGGDGRADQRQTLFVGQWRQGYRHDAGHRPDDRFDPARRQRLEGGSRCLHILLVIFGGKPDGMPADAAPAVLFFDGEANAIQRADPEIGDPPR